MKIRPVRAELFHAEVRQTDGRTDRQTLTKLIVAFRNFTKSPKICFL